jgi:hypothetical protein
MDKYGWLHNHYNHIARAMKTMFLEWCYEYWKQYLAFKRWQM